MIWDGCNECHVVIDTPTAIYATFVLAIVVQEDMSRVVWPSCPAAGWTGGVHKLDSRPNGDPLGLMPRLSKGGANDVVIETHGPYQGGNGFTTVTATPPAVLFDSNIPTTLTVKPTGPQLANIFASEFGCVTMSSFESMSAKLSPDHWSLHGGTAPDTCQSNQCTGNNPMSQRVS